MDNKSFEEKYVWNVLKSYYDVNTIVTNQIESFNDFVTFGMQEIVDQESTISIGKSYKVVFGQISLAKPQVIEEDRTLHGSYPADARCRNLNYDSAIHCNITEYFYEDNEIVDTKKHIKIVIGRMPVMLKSETCNLSSLTVDEQIQHGECPNDPGGYFIIRGNERVLVAQLRTNYNQVFVLKQKPGDKNKYIAEVRSMSIETGHSVLVQALMGSDDRTISFSLPCIKEHIPVGVVFKALGYTKESDIVDFIGMTDSSASKYIEYIIRDSKFCKTQQEALEHMGQYAIHTIQKEKESAYAWQVVETELFPHLGISGSIKEQACFLGHIVRKLLSTTIGNRSVDDRDNYASKRVEVVGTLLYEIFRNLFKKYISFIKLQLEKRKHRPDIISIISRIKSISKGINQCMSTGNWSIQKNASYVRTGVSQILDRMTYGSSLSHLRRILIPVGKEGKNTKIRQIHTSQFGFVCPSECFDPKTKILMWNGDVKYAEEIKVGDSLISCNGTETKVKSTCSGYKKMFTIKHENSDFQDYTVTDNHILTLFATKHKTIVESESKFILYEFNTDTLDYITHVFNSSTLASVYKTTIDFDGIIDVSIEKYLTIPLSTRITLVMFKCPIVNWEDQNVTIDPYILGLWLGNAFSDSEFHELLNEYDLYSNTRIPKEYIVNSIDVRKQILKGIIDSIGIYIDDGIRIISEKRIISDIMFLIRSMGIRGSKLSPTELFIESDIEQQNLSTLQHSTFKLVERKESRFVGWQLEGDGRFLLSDFTVTHNTPEGQKVGIVLNFSLLTRVTKRTPIINIRRIINNIENIVNIENMDISEIKNATSVYLNSILIGYTYSPEETVEHICDLRSKRILDSEISVTYDIIDNDIKIFCDEGRFIRPLFSLKDNKFDFEKLDKYKNDWKKLIKHEIIKYVDASEIENCVIAMKPEMLSKQYNDYCEIHPSVMLGVMASIIPFPDHSQSPRNTYQSAMGKQALGLPVLSYNLRTDTLLHILHYPQRPIVSTKAADFMGFNKMPSGINAIVAIACYTGFNQEDSVIMNLSAIKRGMFKLTSYRSIEECEKKRDTYSYERICIPPANSDSSIKPGDKEYFRRKNGNYSLLDENGVIRTRVDFEWNCSNKKCSVNWFKGYESTCSKCGVESVKCRGGSNIPVKKGDVIIGKVIITGNKAGEVKITDASRIIQDGEEGIIDRVHVNITPNGYKLIKVIIRKLRIPTLGDKFACYDENTEILTKSGWKFVKQVTTENEVACLVNGNRLEYKKPEKVQSYLYKGKMYNVDTNDIDLLVTPNHRMYVGDIRGRNFGVREARDIVNIPVSYTNSVSYWEPDLIRNVFVLEGVENLPDIHIPMIEWCYFYGLCLSSKTYYYDSQSCVGVFIPKVEREIPFLSKLNETTINNNEWCFRDKRILSYFSKTTHFVFREWCFELSMEQTQSLLKGFTAFEKNRTIYTQNYRVLDAFQRLCLHAGWSCKVYENSVFWNERRELYLSNVHTSIDKMKQYNGMVYCCTVPTKEGLIYVRRNGKSAWCGNSRAAQKGTIGMVYREDQMPFTSEGIVPDIIINALCMPSRMTVNQLIECALGKICTYTGDFGDATPFTTNSIDIADKLIERVACKMPDYGLDPHGWETMYNGNTGEEMKAKIFIGPTYYQRLKHMVDDKIHARAKGSVTMLTRQPLEGRSRDGGLRFGEMERDCMIAHGTARFLQERLFDVSDPFQICVCDKCGIMTTSVTECQICKSVRVTRVNFPYASKLLTQELSAMCVKILVFPKN